MSKIILVLVILSSAAKIDFFSVASATKLNSLFQIESHFIDSAEKLIVELEDYIEELNRFLIAVDGYALEAKRNEEKFADNPLQIFRIMKRLVMDWNIDGEDDFRTVIVKELTAESLAQLNQSSPLSLPTIQDLKDIVQSILRLQIIYALSTHDLANGIILGKNYGPRLSASECFEMGRNLFELSEMDYAIEWFEEALNRTQEQPPPFKILRQTTIPLTNYVLTEEILEYLAEAYFFSGKTRTALEINEELLIIDPDNARALQNRPIFVSKAYNISLNGIPSTITTTNASTTTINKSKSQTDELFGKVCRKELVQTPRELRNLHCRYVSNKIPFCLLAPFKMEELSLDPFVAVYHEFIYESENEKIIKSAEGNLATSKIGTGIHIIDTSIRSSRQMWLPHMDFELSQRLVDVTGLSLESGELLQVANYDVGEHYTLHYDFSEVPGFNFHGSGNRMLTALIYLNNVEVGGVTAFPFLRLSVPPIRGSLLIWYNLHESLELDYRTLHGGCPVVKGSKWICTKWFHELGQEFRRPCSVKQNGYKSIKYKGL